MTSALPQQPRRQARSGDGWRTVAYLTWALVLAGTVGVAVSSRTIGRPIWWLGPSSNPASPLWILVPLALVVIPVAAHALRHRRATAISFASSAGLIALALVDVSDSPAVAVGCAVVAGAGAVAHVAVWLGLRQYR